MKNHRFASPVSRTGEPALRCLLLPACLALVLASSCTSARFVDEEEPPANAEIKDYGPPVLMLDPGFSRKSGSGALLQQPAAWHDKDARGFSRRQCEDWLSVMMPRLSWPGSRQDYRMIFNRVAVTNGALRQYRIYGGEGYPALTYQIRRVRFQDIDPHGIGPVTENPVLFDSSENHWYFTVTAKGGMTWQREYEVWDGVKGRVTSRGEYVPQRVTFRFTDAAGADQARSVFQRLAALNSLRRSGVGS